MKIEYNKLLSIAFFLALCSNAYAESPFVGNFEGKMEFDNSGLTLSLNCKSEKECLLTSVTITNGGAPLNYSQELKSLQPVENLNQAKQALKYAKDHKSEQITNKEYAAIFKNLQPLLNSDIDIEKCLDINLGGKGASLVCSTEKSAWETPSLLFMGALLANCGNSFCGYVIYPLIQK